MSFLQLRSAYFDNYPNVPVVTTSAASDITATSATGNGNVTSDGGSAISERGFCWSTASNPTTSDSKVTAAGTTGAYTGTLSSLSASTTYHYRAYAINAFGTSYGQDQSFDTAAAGAVTATPSLCLMGMGA